MPVELLSRIQFAFTISFHILYPAFSIGLITYIFIFETLWLKSGNPRYLSICKFWTKVLALTFGMGIVSGIVMEFQLGTNWSNFTKSAGNVLGVLFTYEVLTAFFIEAGFLGVMFFGWNKVSPKLHYVATFLALLGVTVSTFWILSANSWMQAPSGVNFTHGHFEIVSWFNIIFNPMFIPRFLHMLVATYLATLMVVLAVCAYYLLHNRFIDFSKTCLRVALILLAILVPLQLLIGDEVGLKVHEYQPIKTAAIEGAWETQRGAPFLLLAIPNVALQKNTFELGIPKLASFINTHDFNGELIGLKSVPPADQPQVGLVFYSFRIMLACWAVMVGMTLLGLIFFYRDTLRQQRWYLKLLMVTAPVGFLSIITGWFTAELGRQPWIIYHLLRTRNAASPHVTAVQLLISLSSIIIVYGIIFGFFYFRYFFKIIYKGPDETAPSPGTTFFYLAESTKSAPQLKGK